MTRPPPAEGVGAVIRNFVCAAPRVVFLVELVEPVELRGIRRGQVHRHVVRWNRLWPASCCRAQNPPSWFHRSHRPVPPKSAKLPAVPPVPPGRLGARRFSSETENVSAATDEYLMKPLSWAYISEQLRAIGVEVPATAPQVSEPAKRTDHAPPSQPDVPRSNHRARLNQLQTR